MTNFVGNNYIELMASLDALLNGWFFGLLTIFIFLMIMNIMLINQRSVAEAVLNASFITLIPMGLFFGAGYMNIFFLSGMIGVFVISLIIVLWNR